MQGGYETPMKNQFIKEYELNKPDKEKNFHKIVSRNHYRRDHDEDEVDPIYYNDIRKTTITEYRYKC